MKYALVQSRFDNAVGDVAGAHDGVVSIVRHGKTIEDALHIGASARCVGDQDHRTALLAKTRERVASLRKGGDAVMHDAPDVAKKNVIVARERTKLFDRGNRHCDLNQAIPY